MVLDVGYVMRLGFNSCTILSVKQVTRYASEDLAFLYWTNLVKAIAFYSNWLFEPTTCGR